MPSRFAQRLALIPKEIRAAADAAIIKQARIMAQGMRQIVASQSVDDGQLLASIRLEVQPLRVFIRAGGPLTTKPVKDGQDSSYDYAMAIEFGTEGDPEGNPKGTTAEPFFYPVWRALRPKARRAINRELKAAIEKAAAKP